MAGYVVTNIETMKRLPHGLLAHNDGRTRPETAHLMRPGEGAPVVVLAGDKARAQARLAELWERRKGRRGTRPHEMVALLLGGPPPWGEGEWPREQLREWIDRTMEWAREITGPGEIVLAAFHADEKSPHIHFGFVPVTREGELGWKDRLMEIYREHEYPRSQRATHRGRYQGLHHDYARRVGVTSD